MTVKELKDAINDLSDDMQVIVEQDNGYYLTTDGVYVTLYKEFDEVVAIIFQEGRNGYIRYRQTRNLLQLSML